ncbi:MAG: type VI secretion system tip protein TssI/VgrG [Pseudomonadota bacterium]
MKGPLAAAQMQLLRAEVREGVGKITEIDIEFLSTKYDIKLEDVIGEPISIEIDTAQQNIRYFSGICIEVLFEGSYQGQAHYCASLRAWPWIMTRTADCRIFQDMTVLDIMKEIFGEYGFTDYEDKTQNALTHKRSFCVQYRETDWDFIYRLMVEEGLYFFFDYSLKKSTMILMAEAGQHSSITEESDLEFWYKDDKLRMRGDHIFDWRELERMHSGKITLKDYSFQAPDNELLENSALASGKHKYKDYEIYDWHGRYKGKDKNNSNNESERGKQLARVRMEALKAEHVRSRGVSNVRTLAPGYRFKMTNHPRVPANREYLVVEAIHQFQIETDYNTGELEESALGERVQLDLEKNPDPYRVHFWTQPHDVDFRIPYECPRPQISGLQTAVVQGPSGDEIYTDVYGRVKVKFHWDRNPAKKEDHALTCWIRKAESWAGQSWGMQWVPRVGQEVVVAFEEGDPDRPLIVGMLFNQKNTHPEFRTADLAAPTLATTDEDQNNLSSALAANKNLMGWTTRSTKSGSASTFHELAFDDTKGSEFVRFQSERDYKQIIKNNAEVTIGIEHADAGDFTQTIKNHRTETVEEGDHTFKVAKGKEVYHVEADREMTVNGSHTETIEGDQTVTISGSQTIDVTGEISITSQQKITLKVGGSTITIDTASISIESPQISVAGSGSVEISGGMVDVAGDGMVTMGAPMVEIAGDGMCTVDGGVVMIN